MQTVLSLQYVYFCSYNIKSHQIFGYFLKTIQCTNVKNTARFGRINSIDFYFNMCQRNVGVYITPLIVSNKFDNLFIAHFRFSRRSLSLSNFKPSPHGESADPWPCLYQNQFKSDFRLVFFSHG